MRLATAAAFFVFGVAVAHWQGVNLHGGVTAFIYAILAISGIIVVSARARMGRQFFITLAVLLVIAGLVRGAASTGDHGDNRVNVPGDGESVQVTAWLVSDAHRAVSGVRLNLHATRINDESASFPLTVFASGLSDSTGSGRSSDGFRYGDIYEFTGRFSLETGEYSYSSAGTIFTGMVTLASSGHGSPLRRYVAGVREALANNLDSVMPEPASGIATAMLVGERTGISGELNSDFRESGTSHILAISGLHIALIGGLTLAIAASAFGRRGQSYLLMPLVVTWAYAALAGFSPSVTRAAIMFSVALAARALGRQGASLPGIGFAAAVMVAVEPEILRSLSFQLSFAAIAGISVLTSRIVAAERNLVERLNVSSADGNRAIAAVTGGIAVSVAATISTFPLVAANFGAVPAWGAVATVLMLPAIPMLIISGAAAAIASGISAQLGEVVSWPTWVLGEYIAGVARVFKGIPPGMIQTEGWSTTTTIVAYGLIFLAFDWRRVFTVCSSTVAQALRYLRTRSAATTGLINAGVPAWSIGTVAVIGIVTWTGAITSLQAVSTDDLTVTFFETDRGDMILLRTPNGNTVLIDGGRDPLGAVRSIDRAVPFWDRNIDLLIATHPDADHIGGLTAVLERYDVSTVAEIPTDHNSTVYAAWRRTVDDRGGSLVINPGTVIGLDDGITLEVLSGGKPFPDAAINDASIVTMLRYGSFSMLLTGDITAVTERRLADGGYDLRATVLKVPHHGSDTSSTESFLQAVDPEVAIVQVGSSNRFGHPTGAVVSRLAAMTGEERVFITSIDGEVTVRTDGHHVEIISDR